MISFAPRFAASKIISPTPNVVARTGSRSLSVSRRIPAGRWGDPGDLAGAVVFLASRAADYVSGTILTVDGGWLSR